jgi:hypothetical protein
MIDTPAFTANYADARKRFVGTAAAYGAHVESHVNPCGRGPHAEALACDVAWFGDPHASRVFVSFSGIHGTEGHATSAAQIAWIDCHARQTLPSRVAVLMLHALNPWGFAYRSRCNESFVDLNRNFLERFVPPPADAPFSAEVHETVCLESLDTVTVDKARVRLAELRARYGDVAVERALWGAQYTRADGLSFGGTKAEWSTRIVREVLERRLAHATHIAFIDWHTGVGDFNEVAFILPTPARRNDQGLLAEWWGPQAMADWTRTGLSSLDASGEAMWSVVPGQLRNEFVTRNANAVFLAGATVEFGLTLQEDIYQIETVSRFLHRTSRHTDPKMAPHIERMLTYSLSCNELWRRNVCATGARLCQAAIDGLESLA